MNEHSPTCTVRLLAVPAELYVRNQRHVDDVVHELHIVKIGQQQGEHIPRELADTIDAILEAYARPRDVAFSQAANALKRGDVTVDIEVDLPVEAAQAVPEVIRLLEVVDQLADAGSLLTLRADDELRHLRSWISREVIRQLEGEDPVPYDTLPQNKPTR